MKVLDKKFSEEIAKKNSVSVKDLLNSIHVLHEVREEWSICGHPHIILYADGSGWVEPARFIKNKPTLFEFSNLKQLVKKVKSLQKKYDITWE